MGGLFVRGRTLERDRQCAWQMQQNAFIPSPRSPNIQLRWFIGSCRRSVKIPNATKQTHPIVANSCALQVCLLVAVSNCVHVGAALSIVIHQCLEFYLGRSPGRNRRITKAIIPHHPLWPPQTRDYACTCAIRRYKYFKEARENEV